MKNRQIWNRNFVLICVIGFLGSLGITCSEAVLSRFVSSFGAGADMIGLVNGIGSVSALIALPVSAPIADAYSKKKLFIISTAVLLTSFIGWCFSRSITAIITFRLINGIGKGVSVMVAFAMAPKTLPKEKVTAGVVYFSLAQAISQAFGPSIGLAIQEKMGYSFAFIVSTIIEIICIGIAMMLTIDDNGTGIIKISLHNMFARESILPAILMFCLATSYSTINAFLVVFADETGIRNVGWYFTVYSLVLLISRPFIGKISDKCSLKEIMLPAIGCFAISMIMISLSHTLAMIIASAVVSAFGYGICQPIVQSMCLSRVSDDRRGAGSSTSYIGTNLGYLSGPLVGGKIAAKFGYSLMFAAMLIPLVAGVMLFLIDDKKQESAERSPIYETDR